jgi:hypothetical protein
MRRLLNMWRMQAHRDHPHLHVVALGTMELCHRVRGLRGMPTLPIRAIINLCREAIYLHGIHRISFVHANV